MSRIEWTPEMDAALLELRAQGVGERRIAKRIGVYTNGVRNRARALGLERPATWSPERDAELIALRKQGVGVIAIGKALGLSGVCVSRRVRELNLPMTGRGGYYVKTREQIAAQTMAALT